MGHQYTAKGMIGHQILALLAISVLTCFVFNCNAHASDFQTSGWQTASFPSISDLVSFLNATNSAERVAEFKIISLNSSLTSDNTNDIVIAYRTLTVSSVPDHSFDWSYFRFRSPDEILDYINGDVIKGNKSTKVLNKKKALRDFIVYGESLGSSLAYHLFAQLNQPREDRKWYQTTSRSAEELVEAFNEFGVGKSRITAITVPNVGDTPFISIYIAFYQQRSSTQAWGGWGSILLTPDNPAADGLDVISQSLNRRRTNVPFDNRSLVSIIANGLPAYMLFEPEGFLVYTRNMFLESQALLEFREWKFSNGFDFLLDTADNLWNPDNLEPRHAIRNVFRGYFYGSGIRYILMIGDSIVEPQAPAGVAEGETWEPPNAELSELWNLPMGYYLKENKWDNTNYYWYQPVYTSLFYSDLSDKPDNKYSKDETFLEGDYRLYVGIIPVRTHEELANVLGKTMTAVAANEIAVVYDGINYYVPSETDPWLDAIEALGAGRINVKSTIFKTQSLESARNAFFNNKGIVSLGAHGWTWGPGPENNGFDLALQGIRGSDATRFVSVWPILNSGACFESSYIHDIGWDREFLKALSGPATIVPTPSDGSLGKLDFFDDIFSGHSVGEAFCQNSDDSIMNPNILFGDPSVSGVKRKGVNKRFF
jgi:hypothetical protein